MIVDSAAYLQGRRVDVGCAPQDFARLRAAVARPDEHADGERGFVWVGLHDPGQRELAEVADAFGLHPLAVEDALTAHQRPKLERYDDSLFLVLKTLWYVDAEDAVETGEVALFVGEDFVITVRHGGGSELATARQTLERQQQVLSHGPSSVVYAVTDHVVDGYLKVVEDLQVDVDEVEVSVFSPARTDDSMRIYTLKREIAEARRAVMPLREPMRRFSSGAVSGIAEEAGPFFRDVLDHLNQAAEAVDSLDSLLSTAFDASVARLGIQQNDDMRKISAGAALVVVPTLIAGVYGMNFTHMPELSWTFGYPFALLLMVSAVVGLWVFFKRSGWL
ncbi:magnesium/cobalt transporter CorA [Nocardioides bruguierae]|uniref:magnesium/cobalt transporter CorA n=1 Tax=Nocardioides bruguierae TaxID=2945102 RepID=UPI0020224E2D|nr:magnesium/cobalt transporter CorA [Nocardioides bruguierae]MCL8025849.1 magnesium/cobalt transporter CorA [Nocardioides bruguierae]